VKTILKNTFLTLCFAVYSISVFSSVAVPSFETKFSDQKQTEGAHLTELSNILFPQVINADGNGISLVHVSAGININIDKAYVSTQYLCKIAVQNSVNYFKESLSLIIQFRTEDIIFPFHNFW